MLKLRRALLVALALTIVRTGVTAGESYWVRPGSHAMYVFDKAFLINGVETGSGTYGWRCLSTDRDLAVLNVTFEASVAFWEMVEGGVKETRFTIRNSTIVTTNVTSRALLDEEGHVWGYAHFWIDPAREPWLGDNNAPLGNITMIRDFLNSTVDKGRVDRITKGSSFGLPPLETPFGKFDETVAMWALFDQPFSVGAFATTGEIFQFIYETRLGLLIGGTYMDDILCNKFGVGLLFETETKLGMPRMELRLVDTSLELGMFREEGGFLAEVFELVRANAVPIAATLFIVPLLVLGLRGRARGP